MKRLLYLALLPLAMGLFCSVPAFAQGTETLIDVTLTTTDSTSGTRVERGASTIWYFKLDLTAIDGAGANGVTMSVQYYDSIDDEWDEWMLGCTELTAIGECVLIFTSSQGTDHATLVSEAGDDIDVVHLVPMPGVWRVAVTESTGTPTATYTVTHWSD